MSLLQMIPQPFPALYYAQTSLEVMHQKIYLNIFKILLNIHSYKNLFLLGKKRGLKIPSIKKKKITNKTLIWHMSFL